jgi:ankyrin repeat protein
MCDENGVSPLMHAVINENRSIARLLVQHNADPTQKDNTGRDAFSCSRSESMDEILATAGSMSE